MEAHVLVPLKRLDQGKTRLAGILVPSERVDLVLDLLDHVLTAVREADVGPVTIVSAERLDLDGLRLFDDRGLPWNQALAEAMREIVREPVAAVISADLPLLRPGDVKRLVVSTPERGAAIARAKDGGTNAVGMRPPNALRTRFGEAGSAQLHAHEASAQGLEHVVLDVPGLAFDVDTPEDLERFRGKASRAWDAAAYGRSA